MLGEETSTGKNAKAAMNFYFICVDFPNVFSYLDNFVTVDLWILCSYSFLNKYGLVSTQVNKTVPNTLVNCTDPWLPYTVRALNIFKQ